jgi:hypothetical protein
MRIWPGLLLLSATVACGQAPPTPPLETTITTGDRMVGLHKQETKHDHIWSAVILATNVPNPKEPPSELKEYVPRLKRIFGYNQFEIKGSEIEEIDELTENWLVPTAIFPLSLTARRAESREARGGYLVNLKIFQEKRHLVDTEIKIAPGSPLFIKGPLYGKGQLIILLQVQPK